ncbi:uncharacterized protein LOC143275874 [Babylonia areolata]|uniref:uncharacterized protein LOC143275874 n=1 Tax=Babylonia areolata TaxID=304850 RepID=UPI003FD1D536
MTSVIVPGLSKGKSMIHTERIQVPHHHPQQRGKMTTALPASTFSENQAMCQCYQTPCIRGKMTTALPASTFSENQAMCQCYQTPCIRGRMGKTQKVASAS